MTSQPLSRSPHSDLSDLTARTLVSLGQEEVTLTAALDCLRQVHAALRGGDTAALNEALAGQARAAQSAQAHNAWRRSLCREWADALDTSPDSITLTLLA